MRNHISCQFCSETCIYAAQVGQNHVAGMSRCAAVVATSVRRQSRGITATSSRGRSRPGGTRSSDRGDDYDEREQELYERYIPESWRPKPNGTDSRLSYDDVGTSYAQPPTSSVSGARTHSVSHLERTVLRNRIVVMLRFVARM